MKYRKLLVCVLILFGLSVTGVKAQNGIPSSGGEATGSDGSVSYTVGQTMYQSINGENGSVMPGVQQPYEISIINGFNNKLVNLKLSAYPNPTTEYLLLKANYEKPNELSFQLLNYEGKLLLNESLSGETTEVSMGIYKPAVYFLKVNQGTKELKTFKIIKTNN